MRAPEARAQRIAEIPFDFACNDDYGGWSGLVSAIHLPGQCLELDAIDMRGITFRPLSAGRVRIGRRIWKARHVASHVGNIFWERFALDTPEEFLVWLKSTKKFTVDGGWEEMYHWWEMDGVGEPNWLRDKLIEAVAEDRL